MGLTVKPSTVPAAGLGLFCARDFEAGDLISPYKGQLLSRKQLDKRYGINTTAPYAIANRSGKFIDGVMHTSTGSIHYTGSVKHDEFICQV